MESSRRYLLNNVTEHRPILKNNYNTSTPVLVSQPHQVWHTLKRVLGFYCAALVMKVKQGKSVIWLNSKITVWITISIKSSWRDLFIDVVVDRFIFNNNQITLSPCFTLLPKTVVGLPLKQGLVCTVWVSFLENFFDVIRAVMVFKDFSSEKRCSESRCKSRTSIFQVHESM